MSSRLLITGSSHVAAVKLGWQAIADSVDGVEVDFLAAPSHAFTEFERDEDGRYGRLKTPGQIGLTRRQFRVMRDVNGDLARNLGDYGHVALIGHRTGLAEMLEMAEGVGVDGLRTPPEGGSLLSQPAFDAFARAIAEAFAPKAHSVMLKGPQIVVSAIPQRAEIETPKGRQFAEKIAARRAHPDGLHSLIERFNEILTARYAELGMHLLPQPLDTMTPQGTTLLEYNRGSEHLDEGKSHDDPVHMNATYGELSMRRILDWVRDSSQAVDAA